MSNRVFISSRQRTNVATTDASNCTINLSPPLDGKYAIVSGAISNSVYTVTSNTNTLIFVDPSSHTVTIAAGYYTGVTLAAALQDALTPINASFTVTYSVVTGKLTFGGASLGFTFSGSTIAPIIGLVADVASAASVEMSRPIDLSYNFSGALLRISEASTSNAHASNGNSYNAYFAIDESYGSVVSLKTIEVPTVMIFVNKPSISVTIYNTNGRIEALNSGFFELELQYIGPKQN